MTRIPLWLMVIIAVLGGRAISAQDKYSRERAPGIPEPGDNFFRSPAPSRHAIVPDLPAAAPIPDPQGPPAAEQPAEALAVNTPELSAPVSKAPDLPAEAATLELHPQAAEKPAEAVNTPEHHLDASPRITLRSPQSLQPLHPGRGTHDRGVEAAPRGSVLLTRGARGRVMDQSPPLPLRTRFAQQVLRMPVPVDQHLYAPGVPASGDYLTLGSSQPSSGSGWRQTTETPLAPMVGSRPRHLPRSMPS